MVNQLLMAVLLISALTFVGLCYIGYSFVRLRKNFNNLHYSFFRLRTELNRFPHYFGGVSTPPEVAKEVKREEIKEQLGGRKKITFKQRQQLEIENLLCGAGHRLDDYEVIDIAE